MPEFLLEIGCEEIPASWLERLSQQFDKSFAKLAGEARLDPQSITVYWTPRRIVLRADVVGRQRDIEERLFGPSLDVARDKNGIWTKAAQGFARKNGVTADELDRGPKDPSRPGEIYLVATKRSRGQPAIEVLPGVIAQLLRALAFPKRMNWDAHLDDGKALSFGRPIRWIVALLDGAIVPFTVHVLGPDGVSDQPVRSGNATRGHRFLPRDSPREIAVTSWADYLERLRQAFVLVDPSERSERIRESLEARAPGLAEQASRELLSEWRDLVEYPTVVRGGVPDEFRRLPAEVLQTVLVHHQKYLPLLEDGTVTGFAAVTNASEEAAEEIVRGMERVVIARLRDAAFFYDEDLKRPLADRVSDLARVTFHRGLGSYKDKAGRLERLLEDATALTAADIEDAITAARLAKADLTTLMVGEFPELQGVMGSLYLQAEATVSEDVVAAVRWHYHPSSMEAGSPPAGALEGRPLRLFAAVAVADKLDTLAGYFGLGLVPTGSRDPYALRRAAQGVVRVLFDLWESDPMPDLRSLVVQAIEGHGESRKHSKEETAQQLEAFLLERLRHLLMERGHAADEVEAVLGARQPEALQDVRETRLRIEALSRVRSEARDEFDGLAAAFKRAKNILGGDGSSGPSENVDPGAFEEDAEHALFAAIRELAQRDGGYEAKLRSLASLRGPVDRFFDDVLVMTDDKRLRENRQAVLAAALALFYRIADISRLVSRTGG